MCAIAGQLGGGGSAVRPMIEVMTHRGPDGVRLETIAGATLAHAETLVQTALRRAVGRSGGAAAAPEVCGRSRERGGAAGGGRWGALPWGSAKRAFKLPIR